MILSSIAFCLNEVFRCKKSQHSCSNDITTLIVPFFQQLSPIILLILLYILLKVEKVLVRKNQTSRFLWLLYFISKYKRQKIHTAALHHSLE